MPKYSFTLISHTFLRLGLLFFLQKSHFDNLAQKGRTQKTLKNRGFSRPTSENHLTVTKRPFLDNKTKPKIPGIIFGFSLNNKITKQCSNPIFIVLSQSQNIFFWKLNSKQGNLNKQKSGAQLKKKKKRILENCLIIGPPKHKQW